MLKKFWLKLFTTATGGAVLIAFFNIISRIFGLVRDRLLASYFGAGSLLDSYYAAFRIPDLVFNTLVLGALASAFIPIFTQALIKDKQFAFKIANSILNYLLVILCLCCLIFIILAPQIIPLITPGFSPEQLALTTSLTRIMLISIIFFTVSNVIGGILNSFKRFFTFSLAPVFYNLGIIVGIVAFYSFWGPVGLAWGVVFGSLLHLLVQLPEALKIGWRYQWFWRLNYQTKRVFKLMIPRVIGLVGGQINQIVITAVASTLLVGSVAIFNFANNLQSVPISIFGVSLAIAIFPLFSESLANREHQKFVEIFSLNFRRIIFLIVPTSVFILLLRAQIVRVVLGAGSFDWQDTYYTAQTLGWFSISLFAQSLIPMLARSFYALEDTKTPVVISLAGIGLNIFLSIVLAYRFGVEGLAMAFSIASIINMVALLFALRIKLGYLDDQRLIRSVIKTAFNSILAGSIVYLLLNFIAPLVNMQTFAGIFIQGTVAGLIGALAYLGLSVFTSAEEVGIVKKIFYRYFKPFSEKPKNNE